jgi:hypothetical protein
MNTFASSTRIPTGFYPPAQGCDEGATLGDASILLANPNGVVTSAAGPYRADGHLKKMGFKS